jgi:hypothetical protein
MATTETGALRLHAATATTVAETWSLTTKVREVRVTNRDTDPVFVTVSVAKTAAAAEAGIVTAVADADETIIIPASSTRVVWRGSQARFVAGSIVGNVSTYDIEGSDYHLGH